MRRTLSSTLFTGACFALALTATMGIALAGNLFTLFIFYEMLTLITYPLVTHHGTPEARNGGRVAFSTRNGCSDHSKAVIAATATRSPPSPQRRCASERWRLSQLERADIPGRHPGYNGDLRGDRRPGWRSGAAPARSGAPRAG